MKTILFDLDGTLLDGEAPSVKIVEQLFAQKGVYLSQEDVDFAWGRPIPEVYEQLCIKYELKHQFDDMLRMQNVRYLETLSATVLLFPQVELVLERLKAFGYTIGLVTGSNREEVSKVFDRFEFDQFFEVVVCRDEVQNGKPDPEGFLLAAQKLEVSPVDCVVIEDSDAGVRAGLAAGMEVIGVQHGTSQKLRSAASVEETIAAIQPLLLGE